MSEFEPFDDQLSEALQRRAGTGSTSVRVAQESVLARASHIRRRRAATIGAVALVALAFGGAALVAVGAGDTLTPSDTGDVLPSVDDEIDEIDAPASSIVDDRSVDSPTSIREPATSESVAPVTTGMSVTDTIVTDTTAAVAAPSSVSPPTTSSVTPPSTTAELDTTTTVADSSTSTSEAAPPPIAPFTKTYTSTGGSITVDWNGSAFSLLSVAPETGFEQEIEHNDPLRIRVRFRNDDDDSRIEVRVSDGELDETIS